MLNRGGSAAEEAGRVTRDDLLVAAALAATALLLFADVLAGRGNFFLRDLARFYYPAKQIAARIIAAGELPYWNRFFSAGQPLAANPEFELFYPATWLTFLPAYDAGYRLHILLHIPLSLIAMYSLLRSMGMQRAAAAVGGMSWGLGGVMMSYVNLLPILFSASWLPLTCLYTRRALRGGGRRDAALASLFFGVQCLVGEPTTLIQTGLLLGAYALYRAWQAPRRLGAAARHLGLVAIISTAALFVGIAQILPAADFARDTVRSRGFPLEVSATWSMPFGRLGELFVPHLFGHVNADPGWYWGGIAYAPTRHSPFLFSIYSGLLIVVLALAGFAARLRGAGLTAAVSGAAFVIAAGTHTPLFALLHRAGVAASVRYPEKFAMSAVFAIVIFGSGSLDAMLRGDERVRRRALQVAAALAAIAFGAAALSLMPSYGAFLARLWRRSSMPAAFVASARRDAFVALITAAALVLLLALFRRMPRRWWIACAVAFVLADIVPVAEEINPRMPRSFFELPALAQALPPNRSEYRLFHTGDWPLNEAASQKYLSANRAPWSVRNGLFPPVSAAAGVETVLQIDYDETSLLPTADLLEAMWDVRAARRNDWWIPFMAMSNATIRTKYRGYEAEVARVQGDFRRVTPVDIVPGPRAPRYYFAEEVVAAGSREAFVREVASGRHSLLAAYASPAAIRDLHPLSAGSLQPQRAAAVTHATETANTATIDVDAPAGGLLVMSVTRDRHWRVALDGSSASTLPVNRAYQAVAVGPGKHRVTMHYTNPLIAVGAAVSLAALAILGWFAASSTRRPE